MLERRIRCYTPRCECRLSTTTTAGETGDPVSARAGMPTDLHGVVVPRLPPVVKRLPGKGARPPALQPSAVSGRSGGEKREQLLQRLLGSFFGQIVSARQRAPAHVAGAPAPRRQDVECRRDAALC